MNYQDRLALELSWKKSLPDLSDEAMLKVFPEAIKLIPAKMQEWQDSREFWSNKGLELLKQAKKTGNEDSILFIKELVRFDHAPKVVLADKHFSRLNRLWLSTKGHKQQPGLNVDDAKKVPIEELLIEAPRVSGNRLFYCCPFHKEKTPSFIVFTDDNHFHCFGCGCHGDSITFVMKLKNYDFKEAVKYLLGGQK